MRKSIFIAFMCLSSINILFSQDNELGSGESNVERKLEAQKEVEDLYRKKSECDRQLAVLNSILITDMEFSKTQRFGKDTPVVAFTATNKSDEAFYKIVFTINRMSKDGRAIVASYEESCQVDKLLQPGALTFCNITLLNFKDSVEEFIANSERIEIAATRIETKEWKVLYDAAYFTPNDENRLEFLLTENPELIR